MSCSYPRNIKSQAKLKRQFKFRFEEKIPQRAFHKGATTHFIRKASAHESSSSDGQDSYEGLDLSARPSKDKGKPQLWKNMEEEFGETPED